MNWVFQYDPRRIEMPVAAGVTGWWAATHHAADMTAGDRVYFFRSGSEAGVTAVGELTSSARPQESEYGDQAVDVRITALVSPPLTRAALARLPAVASLPVFRPRGQQGINFRLTSEEATSLDQEIAARSWDLRPGDHIRRTELHKRFGGSRQGGISSSAQTPNVFLFTDPSGIQHGYIGDGPGDDGTFHYTGEGQHGDQLLQSGNLRLLHHKDRGMTVRLFKGARGSVTYVGEYEVDPETPYERMRAPETGGGPLRNVLVFHLRPVQAAASTARVLSEPIVTDVPIEAQNTERYFVSPAEQSAAAERREADLVQRFVAYMRAAGHTVDRKKIVPATDGSPLYTDIHIEDLNLLIEAKGTTTRGPFRTAIGQLADYRRFLNGPTCAILLPARPSEDLVSLASAEGIRLYWRSGNQFELLEPAHRGERDGSG